MQAALLHHIRIRTIHSMHHDQHICSRKHAGRIVASHRNVHNTKHAQQPQHANANMQGTLVRRMEMCTIPSMHGNMAFMPMALGGPGVVGGGDLRGGLKMCVSCTKTNRHPQPKSSWLIYIYIQFSCFGRGLRWLCVREAKNQTSFSSYPSQIRFCWSQEWAICIYKVFVLWAWLAVVVF
jgi:hypothetical protein